MRAIRLTQWGQPPELVDVPVPDPRGEELLLRVDAAGLCGSDLHLADASTDAFAFDVPFTLGHEVVGTVVAAGPEADVAWMDAPVVVHGLWSCGTCRSCVRGRENYCFAFRRQDGRGARIGAGIGRDGGLADYMVVPSTRVLVRADGVDPRTAAPLADAGLTAYHSLARHEDVLDERSVVVVVGVGGLGHLALQLLRLRGVGTVVAVDSSPAARDLARRLGADAALATLAEAADHVEDAAGHRGADLVLDFVGAGATPSEALSLLAPGGRVSVIGSGGAHLTVGKNLGLEAGWSVHAPFWGTRAELEQVVRLAQQGHLSVETTPHRLEDVPAVYEQLRTGSVHGRAVAVPHDRGEDHREEAR